MEYVKGLLSICCTCYNHEEFIKDFVQSVWDNDYKNVEIIVVDDGSTDKSVEVLRSLQAKSPCRFEIISQENTYNIGLNCNRAIAKARGEFITFMSADDYYTNDAFSKKLDIMNNDNNIAFIISRNVNSINNGKIMGEFDQLGNDYTPDCTINDLVELEYKRDTFSIQGMIVRREIIDAINGFDEDIKGDDIVIKIKILRYMAENPKWQFRIINNVSFIYRVHNSNYSTINKDWILEIYLDVFDRYWAERPYPAHVVVGLIDIMAKLGYEKFMPILGKHPRFLNLTIQDKRFGKNFARELDKFLNRKCFFDFLIKKEEFYDKDIYRIFRFIKITHTIKHQERIK